MVSAWTLLSILFVVGSAAIPAEKVEGWAAFTSSSLSEQVREVELGTTGTVPSWLNGAFLKNSAGRFSVGPRSLGNLQDGFAKVYRWRFENGQIYFNTRFLQSPWLQTSLGNNTITPLMVISPVSPEWTPAEAEEVLLSTGNNPNINLHKLNGTWLALSETYPHLLIDPDTLDTLGVAHYEDDLNPKGPIAAMSPPHPLTRPNGDTISFYLEPNEAAIVDPALFHHLTIYKWHNSLVRTEIAKLKLSKVHYVHAFSLTTTHAIIFTYPYYFNYLVAPLGPYLEHFLTWDKKANATAYVIDLSTGEQQMYTMPPTFCFHHVNAWNVEEAAGGGWTVDALCYDQEHAQTAMQKWNVTQDGPPTGMGAVLHRFNIPKAAPLRTNEVTWHVLHPQEMELPRLHPAWNYNASYCFVYGWTATGIVKVDLCRNTTVPWTPSVPAQFPSEAVFIPKLSSNSRQNQEGMIPSEIIDVPEDDGVLVSVVFDGTRNSSYLLVLDARTMEEVARAPTPIFTPFSIHGQWNPEATNA